MASTLFGEPNPFWVLDLMYLGEVFLLILIACVENALHGRRLVNEPTIFSECPLITVGLVR